ncbi:MAG TPA: hypothetical protein VK983_00185 [Candidatus Limnocylindrales bacterium]|nr:hypothetical protein [Candidatus Limnocylindrales bacterium]
MIQFNLLPDVKLEYAKAQRTKRTVIGAAAVATAASFGIFLLLFLTVHVVQRKSISDLNGDIKQYSQELKDTKDLNKILTIQNQLASVNGLHDKKAVASRVFDLTQQVTPADVTINELEADYIQNTISITGQAPALQRVNTFTDTLKFATFTTKQNSKAEKVFSNVVLSQFSRTDQDTTYTITASFSPELFSNAADISLTVPANKVTTRSVVEQPSSLFKAPAETTNTTTNR